jgi:DNA-directed RNA polymerase specialized sigma24 family protein
VLDMNGMDAHLIDELLGTLTRTERLLLMLHYAEELAPDEIAAVLELTQAHVNSTLDEIRRRTQAVLTRYRLAG